MPKVRYQMLQSQKGDIRFDVSVLSPLSAPLLSFYPGTQNEDENFSGFFEEGESLM
jgi:hypothetical protein